jgi:hypothetical protein
MKQIFLLLSLSPQLENAKRIEAESSEESSQAKAKPGKSSGSDSGTAARPVHFDSQLKLLEKKLREGSTMEVGQRGANKVSAMAEQLASKLEYRSKSKVEPNPLLQRSVSSI